MRVRQHRRAGRGSRRNARPQDERVITDVSPLEDQIRNIVGFTTSTGGPYDFEQADHKSAVQAYGAEPAEGAVALLRVYARAEDRGDASINSSGHSFLSVRNVSDHDIEVGGLRIAPDTEMTFWPSTAIWLRTIPRSPTTTLFITAPA